MIIPFPICRTSKPVFLLFLSYLSHSPYLFPFIGNTSIHTSILSVLKTILSSHQELRPFNNANFQYEGNYTNSTIIIHHSFPRFIVFLYSPIDILFHILQVFVLSSESSSSILQQHNRLLHVGSPSMLYLCNNQELLVTIVGDVAHNQQESMNQIHEQYRQYFAGLAMNVEVNPLSNEMIAFLQQSSLQCIWIDAGDVKAFMDKERVKQILLLSVQQGKNELLVYFLKQGPL